MQPVFRIEAAETDITARLQDRLLDLQITLTSDTASDSLRLILDNRDLRLPPLPDRTPLKAWLGYRSADYFMGEYRRSELSYDLVPLRLTVRATAADFSPAAGLKTTRVQSWENTTLGDVVRTIASRHGYEAVVASELASVAIEHEDQTNESDLHFLRRLAGRYNAIFKATTNRLLFTVRGAGRSAGSGAVLPALTLLSGDITSGRVTHPERPQHSAVVATYHDPLAGSTEQVVAGNLASGVHRLRFPGANRAEAKSAAEAELARLNQAAATIRIRMPGRPAIYAEQPLVTRGWAEGIDGSWTITRVTHHYNSSQGFTTYLDGVAK